MAEVRRPALRFYGSKWRLAPWIVGHFGAHEVYVEPFGGSAAVLLRKERSLIEVYNDLDLEVVNFFYVLREFPERLIELLSLTPFALWEYAFSWDCRRSAAGFLGEMFGREREFDWVPGEVDAGRMVEAARLFYVRSYLGMTGPMSPEASESDGRRGFRRQKVFSRGRCGKKVMTPAAVSFVRTEKLRPLAERLRGVTIDCLDGVACIERYDSAESLFYVDPPYLRGVRRRAGAGYGHELDDGDHEALLAVLRGVKGQVVLSGYGSALYEDVLGDWERFERRARVDGAGSAVEVLWVNEAAVAARKGIEELPLFRRRS